MNSLFRYKSDHSGGSSRTIRIIILVTCITFIAGPYQPTIAAEIKISQEQFKTGRYTECLESTRKAIENGAYAAEWRALMIKSLMALGQYNQAADDMDIYAARVDDLPERWRGLVTVVPDTEALNRRIAPEFADLLKHKQARAEMLTAICPVRAWAAPAS